MPSNATMEVKEIWKQPDGAGYRPCLEFGIEYVRTSAKNGFLYNFIHDRSYTYSCSGFQAPLLPDPLGDKMVMNTGSLGFQVLTLQNGAGYKPCLEAVINDPRTSEKISKQKRRFLVVVASGGLNQIIDAVVIATVLEAALVVPTLQVNFIWGDESEFSDIFHVERRTRHGAFNPLRPEFLIGRLNMSYEQQKFAGLCPLNACSGHRAFGYRLTRVASIKGRDVIAYPVPECICSS